MINLCIPTLNRYDLLEKAITSAIEGTLKPDSIVFIDNGGYADINVDPEILKHIDVIHRPEQNMGCAASWNWFIDNVDEIRVIANDDVIFFEDTLEILNDNYDPERIIFPAGLTSANVFSCFILPDSIIQKVGYFDEDISPRYAYFEDNDYCRRMLLLGLETVGVSEAQLFHDSSGTMKQLWKDEHDAKFRKASKNYAAKWGGPPLCEKFDTPYNRG